MYKINELSLDVLTNQYGLDFFDEEEYTLNGLNHNTIDICGFTYHQGDVLKEIDPTAFRQMVLDFTENLYQDEAIEETADGHFVWVQDVNLKSLGLELNE